MDKLRTLVRKILPHYLFIHLHHWWIRSRLALQDFNKTPPILIYQMGKVGSAAIYQSLKKSGVVNPVHHVHFLSYNNLDDVERFLKSAGTKNDILSIRYWRAIRRKVERANSTVYLISLVRDPIAREISNIFQNIHFHKELMTDTGGVDIEKALGYLNDYFANFDEKTDFACTWFDKEVLDAFKIDVYATPFDHARGYSIIENGQTKLLLFRMEDLARVFTEAMQEFMGISIPIVRANEAASKEYYDAYKAVTKRIVLPRAVCEKIYSSRHARHFYSDELRSEFISKWTSANRS